MKHFFNFIFTFTLMGNISFFGMNHNGTDIESSDSDSELENKPEEMYLWLDEPGAYLLYYNLRLINKSAKVEDFILGVYINNKKTAYKQYKINAHSIQIIKDFIPVTVTSDDLIQIKFNAPNAITLENNGIDFILVEPKTKL